MAKFSSIYKQTGPTRRIVNGENSYEKGMMWSNQALMPGYTRTLLNFEIDVMTGALTIPGGFHVNTIAAGCTYIDKLYYSDGTYRDVVVTQPRNEHFLRAFEGITNILSVQKLNAKDILQQVSNAPQYLNSVDNVNCYKIITYNPFNHRMVVITLLQTSNSSYVLNQDLTIYRLNSNPISMGFSEIWKYAGEPYISNKTDLFPQGMEDTYTVRPRRIKLNETFGKTLHHDYHMHSVPHTEGFGNKTFMFTQEQLTLDSTEEDNTVVKDIETKVFSNPQITGSSGYSVRDIIFFKPLLASYNDDLYPEGDRIQYLTIQVVAVSETGAILDFKILSPGRFIRTTPWADGTIDLTPINGEGVTGSITSANTINNITENYSAQDILNIMDSNNLNPFKNNKYIGNHTSSGRNIIVAKDDNHYFGLLLTGLGIRTKTHNETSALLLNTATVNSDNYPENPSVNSSLLDVALVNHLKQSEQLLKLNLNTGTIEGNSATEEVDLFITPVLKRIEGNSYLNQNITDLSKLFKQHVFEGDKKIFLPDFLTDNVKRNLQIGQSIRVAAYCKVDVPLPQNYILNNLRTDVDESNYYRKKTPEYSSVFLLEYVWDGIKWNFTFVDTAYKPDSQPYFMSNWDASSLYSWVGRNTPKLVTSTEVKANHLSYLDIVTADNQAQMCKTKNSPYAADLKRIGVGDLTNKTLIAALDKEEKILDLDLDETLSDVINTGAVENTLKKLNNTQYAHFKLTPKELTPAMAARWGYNMLSPTPYTFICQNTPGLSISLTGVLLMRGNQPLLTPLVNTPGELHIYYNADFNDIAQAAPQRYQISVEYKNIYDEWRSLKEYSVAESHSLLSSGRPIVLPFSSPDEIVLIKVTILDRETVVDVALTDGSTEEHFLVVSSLITTLNFVKNATQASIMPEIYDLGTALGLTYWKGRLVCWGVEKAHNMLFLSESNEPEYFAYPNGVDIFEEDIKHVINYSDALIVFTSTKIWRIDMSLDGLTWTKSLLQQNIRISDNDIPYITIIKNMLFFKSDKQFFMLVPQKSSTTGELTIAPISRAIADFLKNPFDNLLDMVETIYPEFRPNENPNTPEFTNPADDVEYPTPTENLTISELGGVTTLYGKGTADLSEYLSIPPTVQTVSWYTETPDVIPTVYVPSSVKRFHGMGNSGIQNIYFKEGLEELSGIRNNNLTEIYIPKSVKLVESSAFTNNPSLEKIVWATQAPIRSLGTNIGLKELYLLSDKYVNCISSEVFNGTPHTVLVYAPLHTHTQYLNDPSWRYLIDNGKVVLKALYGEDIYKSKTPFDYLIKYGVHIEQNKVFVDWWFDMTAWKYQEKKPDIQDIVHDYEGREYWLIQLIYDTQTYSWSIQTHSTNSVGHFVNDAANSNTDLINLVFSPEFYVVRQGLSNYNLFQKNSPPYSLYDRGSYGVSISNRKTTEEKLLNNFNLNLDQQVIPFEPTYPRFQIFDTGYKEVSTPALKKRFREIQFTFEPRPSTKVAPDGDSVNIKAVLLAQIDGHTVMSSVSQEVVEELEDETLIIKVVDKINYQDIQLDAARTSIVPLPYLVDSELSNTFVLESSALSGVKQVKVRRAINGKGQLIRMRFVNITESNYAIISHAFVSHNKNAR